eukprot:PhM_4_TR18692/c0_g1_i4/m.19155
MSDQYSFTTIQELVLTDNVDAITSYLTRCHLEHEDHPIDPEDGRTILHLAAANGCENILSWLIKNMSVDLDVQTTETLWTPLLFAVFNGKYGAVESLLLAGADPFISDKYGDTASDLSNMTDNPNIKLLLRDHELQRLGDPNSPVTPELAAALQKRRSTMARFSIAARGGGGGNDDDNDNSDAMSTGRRGSRRHSVSAALLAQRRNITEAEELMYQQRLEQARRVRVDKALQRIHFEIFEVDRREDVLRQNLLEREEMWWERWMGRHEIAMQIFEDLEDTGPRLSPEEIAMQDFLEDLQKKKLPKREKERLIREEAVRLEGEAAARAVLMAGIAELEKAMSVARESVVHLWISELAIIFQLDTLRDKRHPGSYDPIPAIWTCCGHEGVLSEGCVVAEDPFATKLHSGKYTYHPYNCDCDDALCVSDHSCWSCCGAPMFEDEGCTPPPRYLQATMAWADLSMRPTGNLKLTVRGALCYPAFDSKDTRHYVHKDCVTVVAQEGYLSGARAWELTIDLLPLASVSAHESGLQVVIGAVTLDTPETSTIRSRHIGGESGIGWWQGTPFVRGHNQRVTLQRNSSFSFGDSVTVLLDFVNGQICFFLNRKYVGCALIDASRKYYPAITLIPGATIGIVHRGKKEKENASYVQQYITRSHYGAKGVRRDRVLDMDDLAG